MARTTTARKTENTPKNRLPSGIDPEVQNLLNALPFSVQLIDSNHRIVAVNKVLKQNLGMDESRLIGEHCSVVIRGLNGPVTDCPLEEAVEKGISIERELFNSETSRWINASVYPTPIVTHDNLPTYLHFLRDVTEVKNTATELTRNLEHHKALCDFLQNLQNCENCPQILDTLIDQVLSLSWLGMATTAAGFMVKGKYLELVAHRNVSPDLKKKCKRLARGECLCGKAFETGRPIICSSNSLDHSIKFDGITEHQHAILPIRNKDNTFGVLTLYLNPGDVIDGFRLGFLEAAAAAAAVALEGLLAKEAVIQAQERCLAHIISSQEDERKRVASDLHDKLCQSLSAILMELQSNRSPDADMRSIQPGIEFQIRSLIDQVRNMAGQLRPAILDDFGLKSALARKTEEISRLQGIAIDYQCVCSIPKKSRLPSDVEIGLYRVTMEAVMNAVTHSKASHISVIFLWRQKKATILVEDDGCGFDYQKIRKEMDRARGLIEMEERMAVLGGKLQIESASRKGTTVRAEMPLGKIRKQPEKPVV